MGRVGYLAAVLCFFISADLCLGFSEVERAVLNGPETPVFTGDLQGQVSLVRKDDGMRFVVYTAIVGRDTAIFFRSYDAESGRWGDNVQISPADVDFNRSPHLWLGEDGTLHCAWVSRNRRSYRVLYRRLKRTTGQWSEPTVFPAGIRHPSPRLAGDPQGNLYLFYWGRTGKDEWGRIFFQASTDGGETWAEADPNYHARKGEASSPRFAPGRDQGAVLAWLDQTPGETSLVVNRLTGEGWSGPRVVNGAKGLRPVRPRLERIGEDLFLAWSVVRLKGDGVHTELWVDWSNDDGENWNGNRLLVTLSGNIDDYRLVPGSEGVRLLWIENGRERAQLKEKLVTAPDGPGETVWRSNHPGSLSMLNVRVTAERVVVAAGYKPRDEGDRDRDIRGKILILSRRLGEAGYRVDFLEGEGRGVNATSPSGLFVDSAGWAEFCFVEVAEPIHPMQPLDPLAKAVWGRIRIGESSVLIGLPPAVRGREVLK